MASKPRAAAATHATAPEVGCQVGDLFRLLGKAHMLDILHVFTREAEGPLRFVDLQHKLGLSPNTLSERLRELVEAGLLTRTAYNEIPPRVDYAITAKARELNEVFETLWAWSQKHNLQPVPEPSSGAAKGVA